MKIISILSLVLLSGCGSSSKSTPIEAVEPLTSSRIGSANRFHRDAEPPDGLTYKQQSEINKAEISAAKGRFGGGIYGESKYQ